MSKDPNNSTLPTEPYKGVRDFYPKDQAFLNYFLDTCRRCAEEMGYVEYHSSILEPAELYKAKGAENEEIANEQTYTFTDRGGREVTLRPEMTPTVARMVAGKRRELGFPLRWFSIPNVFRYERPQRGRLREHWQLNVDLFGSRSPMADAEVVRIAYSLMKAFGAEDSDFVIKVGSRSFLDSLLADAGLTPEQAKRLRHLLDAKDKMERSAFTEGLAECGVEESRIFSAPPPQDAQVVLEVLRNAGITNAVWDPSIVRGFDYYTGTVFEVFDTHPKNNRALFGGGRYDNLTKLFDEEPLPGVGFGMGDATIRDFLDVRGLLPSYRPPTHLYIAVPSPNLAEEAQELAQTLREQGVSVATDFGERKLGDQIKAASKHGIPHLIVLGENELASGTFAVRDLMSGTEKTLGKEQLADFFLNLE